MAIGILFDMSAVIDVLRKTHSVQKMTHAGLMKVGSTIAMMETVSRLKTSAMEKGIVRMDRMKLIAKAANMENGSAEKSFNARINLVKQRRDCKKYQFIMPYFFISQKFTELMFIEEVSDGISCVCFSYMCPVTVVIFLIHLLLSE